MEQHMSKQSFSNEEQCKCWLISEIGYTMANNKYVFNDAQINLLGSNELDETLQNLNQFKIWIKNMTTFVLCEWQLPWNPLPVY